MYDRMDTLLVENDKFSKTVSLDTLIAARLLFSDGTQYPFFMDEGNKIQIKGSAAELNSLEISGNTPNEEFSAFQKELKGLGTPSEKVLEDKAGKFINEHHSSLVSIYLLDKYFVQKEKPDYAQIKKLTEHMTGELKDRPYIDELLNHIQEEEKADGESFEILKGGYIPLTCNKVTDESILNKFHDYSVTAVYSVEVPKTENYNNVSINPLLSNWSNTNGYSIYNTKDDSENTEVVPEPGENNIAIDVENFNGSIYC